MISHTCKTCGQSLPVVGSVARIIHRISEYTGVSAKEIKGPYRGKSVARARFGVYYLARNHTNKSFPKIGEAVGRRDHTTIMYGLERANHLIKTDQAFADMIATCSATPDGQESFL